MAHFYGIVAGASKTRATRRGHKGGGLVTTAASWEGAVRVYLHHNQGRDYYVVKLLSWPRGDVIRTLAEGYLGEAAQRTPLAAGRAA